MMRLVAQSEARTCERCGAQFHRGRYANGKYETWPCFRRRRFCSLACQRPRTGRPAADRLWERVEKRGPDECWPFCGVISSRGYGLVTSHRHTDSAHRLAYTSAVGPIPLGHVVCHRCDNPICCNPAHLFVGTQKDNIQDCIRKGRRAPHCGGTSASAPVQVA